MKGVLKNLVTNYNDFKIYGRFEAPRYLAGANLNDPLESIKKKISGFLDFSDKDYEFIGIKLIGSGDHFHKTLLYLLYCEKNSDTLLVRKVTSTDKEFYRLFFDIFELILTKKDIDFDSRFKDVKNVEKTLNVVP